MLRWLIPLLIIAVIEFYSFQALRTVSKSKTVLLLYVVITILVVSYLIYQFSQFDRSVGQTSKTLFTMGLFLLFMVPKLSSRSLSDRNLLLSEMLRRKFSRILASFCIISVRALLGMETMSEGVTAKMLTGRLLLVVKTNAGATARGAGISSSVTLVPSASVISVRNSPLSTISNDL